MLGIPAEVTKVRNEWEIASDCETLIHAMAIVEDEERLKAAQEYFKSQKEKLEKLSDSEFMKKIGFR